MGSFLLALLFSSYVWYRGCVMGILVSDYGLGLISSSHLEDALGVVLIGFAATLALNKISEGKQMSVAFLSPARHGRER
jgi:hypothetical protein